MTIEAEELGAKVTLGSKIFEPHVTEYAGTSVTEWKKSSPINLECGRAKVVLDAIRILKEKNLDVPIIGNLVGCLLYTSNAICQKPHLWNSAV